MHVPIFETSKLVRYVWLYFANLSFPTTRHLVLKCIVICLFNSYVEEDLLCCHFGIWCNTGIQRIFINLCFWFEINSWIHIEISFLWEEKQIFLFIQFRRQTLIDWSMSLSDKNKMKRNCFDNSHKLSPFFFFWLKLIKKLGA